MRLFNASKRFALAFAFSSLLAFANTIEFNLTASSGLAVGNLPQSVVVPTFPSLTVSGWKISEVALGTWISTNVILNNRNQAPDDRGLGVCSDAANCPATGNGTINEIDNDNGYFEVIRMDFGVQTFVNAIGLSSLDSGAKDHFAIFGSSMATPNLNTQATLLAKGSSLNFPVNPSVNINASYRYFFVSTQFDNMVGRENTSPALVLTDADFLLQSVNYTAVPEPGLGAIIGLAVLALGIRKYRHRIDPSR